MKLKNKKTGEIKDACEVLNMKQEDGVMNKYYSLTELNKEWEDYEEPEGWWFIDGSYEPHATNSTLRILEADRQIGNYFETKEEAELAVRKLMAWKRLKDNGFRFTGINDDEDSQELITQCGILCEANIYHLAKDEDFLLLFGGKE